MFQLVMRGLDPRIPGAVRAIVGMDRRVKPGDDSQLVASVPKEDTPTP